ncbi:MAG: thioredoxin domain-containing protein [Prolixibacteraceae bacterium]
MSDTNSNRLIHETSPYLLQHAHNPVDWYPWGAEALEKAKNEDKLLLISIGYSACHWCHVMEHESFEDSVVAKIMNDNFVCIKVDREERPDIDQVYMDAVQLMTGRGGWPLNCFALPDGSPVYGGTYFRKTDWISLLKQLAKLYQSDRTKLIQQANAVHDGVMKQEKAQDRYEKTDITHEEFKISISKMAEGFDSVNGGFNGAPKFPMPSVLEYLLEYSLANADTTILQHLQLSLNKMAMGGIYDHVGGGFSRYSTDEEWHIPHFEKMLYDNSQLVSIYSKAYTATKNEHYKRVVYETLQFIQRELTSDEGAFYASLDADSEGEEGKFYAWTAKELKEHLGNNYPLIAEFYSVTAAGNWENGVNVLKSVANAEQFSMDKKLLLNDFLGILETSDNQLLSARSKRIRPGLDDKILSSWNALMLKAYLDAYQAFETKTFLDAALKNGRFIQGNMLKSNGSLYRSYKNGESKINGFLDDYSFTISAFIELYQLTFDEEWLVLAKKMTDHVLMNFEDSESDFFFYTSKEDAPLAQRKKEISDNVIPSSNSSMAENLFLLSNYFSEPSYADKAIQMANTMAFEVQNHGRFYSNWGRLLVEFNSPHKEVVITGPDAVRFLHELQGLHAFNVLYAMSEQESQLPIFEGRFVKGKTMIYVCENQSCKLPVSTVAEALKLMQ